MATIGNNIVSNSTVGETFQIILGKAANVTSGYGSWAFNSIQAKVFDTFHANGTLHTAGDLLTPVVKRVHEFFVADEGFLGGKFAQFTELVAENPHTFTSRVLVFGGTAYLAKLCFTAAWFPKYQKDQWGNMDEIRPSILKRIPLYLVSLGAAAIAGYEVVTALSGRATCMEGFHDCVHPLWSSVKEPSSSVVPFLCRGNECAITTLS